MFDYFVLKEKFYRLSQDAEGNVRKDKLKAPIAPPVYEGLHDHSLARMDVFRYLTMSHYETKSDFLEALHQLIETPAQSTSAFDEKRYAESRKDVLQRLIEEYQ